jgi:hypothetical protein
MTDIEGPSVLAAVRDHVRSERADDAALEALARGESDAASVASLEARAEGEAEVRAMIAASKPLGDAAIDRITARVHAKAAKAVDAGAKRNTGNVVAFMRRAAVVVGPLALAAVVVLYAGRGGEKGHALLPDYTFVASGEQTMRGANDTAPALRLHGGASATFEITARPATQAGAKVVAYVFAIEADHEPSAVDASVEVAPEGAIRIRGRARALDGAREVRVVIGTANDSIKRYEDALTRARDGQGDVWTRVLVIPIVREK